jgi:alpha-ketoglutarate-dependent taurine dioxygenase
VGKVTDWINKKKEWIEEELYKYGAIVFRDFGLSTPEDFDVFGKAFGYEYEEFIGGGGPRLHIVGNVYTSTESPAHLTIPFHHELAYLTHFPSKLAFYCDQPPADKGETPILLSNRLYKLIAEREPQFLAKVIEKKIRYLRIIDSKNDPNFSHAYQRGWEDIFETNDRSIAEQRAKDTGTDTIEWLPNGSMKVISKPLDAIRPHPITKELTWFNSVVLLHPCIYGTKDKPWRSIYGDFTELEEESILNIYKISEEEGVRLKWNKGDVMLIDNYGALHARNSFTPPRRVLVSMFK